MVTGNEGCGGTGEGSGSFFEKNNQKTFAS
jgi:hypothetical protein